MQSKTSVRVGFAAALCVLAAVTNADDLAIAKSALRDGLWDIARKHAEIAGGDEGRLIVLESYANEGKWDEIRDNLARSAYPTNEVAFAYYLAGVEGRLDDALQALRQAGQSSREAEVKMLEADLRLREGDRAAAEALWREVLALPEASERIYAQACCDLGDVTSLRTAYDRTVSLSLKRRVGLRLGRALLDTPETVEDGEDLIRAIVRTKPEEEGAAEAFRAIAVVAANAKEWKRAEKIYRDMIEIWPALNKSFAVREGRGEALFRLDRYEDALASFEAAENLAENDEQRARVMLRRAECLSKLSGRGPESMQLQHRIIAEYSGTETARELKRVEDLRSLETKGRDLYKAFKFVEARAAFAAVAAADPSSAERMAYLEVLCLYGDEKDDLACAKATALAEETCKDPAVRADAMLWLAKFTYNRKEWLESMKLFVLFSEERPDHPFAAEALLWAARAAAAKDDHEQTIQLTARIRERYPDSQVYVSATILQAEALIATSRLNDVVTALEGVTPSTQSERFRLRLYKANALLATGGDNFRRYHAAVEEYQAILQDEDLDPEQRLIVSFRLGRALEKLKRYDEAADRYYSHVVCAYVRGRENGEYFNEDASAMFVQAAFWLADEYARYGHVPEAITVLDYVIGSGLPAAEQAKRKKNDMYKKGIFE